MNELELCKEEYFTMSKLPATGREYLLFHSEEDRRDWDDDSVLDLDDGSLSSSPSHGALWPASTTIPRGWRRRGGSEAASRNAQMLEMAIPLTICKGMMLNQGGGGCGEEEAQDPGAMLMVFNFLLVPERFLDEERRLVAGTMLVLEGMRAFALETQQVEGVDPELREGRFVVNLEDMCDFAATFRLKSGNVVLITHEFGHDGLIGCRRWVFNRDNPLLRKGQWPTTAFATAMFRANCQFCLARGQGCSCSNSFMRRMMLPRTETVPDWSTFQERLGSIPPVSRTSTFSFKCPIRGDVCVGFSTDLLLNGNHCGKYLLDMKAKFMEDHMIGPKAVGIVYDTTIGSSSSTRLMLPSTEPKTYGQRRQVTLSPIRSDESGTPPLRTTGGTPNKRQKRDTARYPCSECDREFYRPSRLAIHYEVVHNGQTLFSCEICNKTFTSSGNLSRHNQMVHLKVKRHFCSFCNKGFFGIADLRVHERRMHSTEATLEATAE
eukprot:CAMPEP_0184680402 /NCGR_PEP_ID=MMETSP0312-20130426/3270_1 /TAXON_ID=31354 /ORGANISM="Compsopogon coeruleus, Strain SAG 36.94" /LENGTH=491 /DNA_ID=CAMNT_0027130471 /DNA_START=65 /DNA_END=1540 /DNA_ORIENTATION=-